MTLKNLSRLLLDRRCDLLAFRFGLILHGSRRRRSPLMAHPIDQSTGFTVRPFNASIDESQFFEAPRLVPLFPLQRCKQLTRTIIKRLTFFRLEPIRSEAEASNLTIHRIRMR